ncbi:MULTISPECIES: hypothetical protein [unclassified Actinomyces]|uniref:hypothetical protein n=1 Tax=unclassified Actinomyces TaxID=2609248 RepID=UPI001373A89A|nr:MULTISPECIES: hypothetical protein [unclassified Actinomyces]MBW3068220.1 hypothetical protein [Actinomyces sp. 594]NDR53658.1 hypothetical protein [Actinomyces sp. 565]QHO90161.1 hypothetical protein CWT12_00765 [Actinomyces sp. 432]
MPRENEQAVLDSARVHHARLRDALERGRTPGRSRAQAPRLIASLVVAALACSGCVGYAYVSTHLDSIRSTPGGSTSTPTDSATVAPAPPQPTDAAAQASQEAEQ